SAANLRAPSSMLLKNSLASDFITRPTTGFFSSARAEDPPPPTARRARIGNAAHDARHFVFMVSSLETASIRERWGDRPPGLPSDARAPTTAPTFCGISGDPVNTEDPARSAA